MMRAADCSFCQHANPPEAKFCNACGAPLYLVPCPHCGAVNETTAIACHQCARKLEVRADGPAPPAARVLRSAGGGARVLAASAPDSLALKPPTSDALDPDAETFATLQRLRQLLEESDPGAAAGSPGQENPAPPVPHVAREPANPADAPRYPVSAVTEPTARRHEPRAARRGPLVVVIGAAALAVLAASAFYAYRWVADTRALPMADKARDAGAPVAAGTIGKADSAAAEAPAGSTPATGVTPAATNPIRGPASTIPPVRPGTVDPGDAKRPETGASARLPAAAADPRRGGTEARDSSSGVPAAAPVAAPRSRATEAAAGFELQQPRLGPCTEAMAALGLCTREPAQGRE
jgi:hypothetical protein